MVKKVSFTGSVSFSCGFSFSFFEGIMMTDERLRNLLSTQTRVGKILMAQSSNTLKKLSMELGGNAPFVRLDSYSNSCLPRVKEKTTSPSCS